MKRKIAIIAIGLAVICSLFLVLKKGRIAIDHIFLITIDTLRADHLGCYEYPRTTSTFIDGLAEKGILFTRAFSQSSTTNPSHASIFTGLYPSQHRVLANGWILEDSYTTVPEILKADGFRTAAFASTSDHFLRSNMDQGFDFYEEPDLSIKEQGFEYRLAQYTINNAITWLYNFPVEDKLFLWVHLFDPHTPYYPKSKYLRLIKNEMPKESYLEYLEKYHINLEVFDNNVEKMFEVMNSYDAEIRYLDVELERFYNFVHEKGLNRKTLWIITSDHGEALGQHDWRLHGKILHQEVIHVPLIFYFTEKQVTPMRINDIVENFDIFSTVLDVMNIKLDNEFKNKVKSVSLHNMMIKGAKLEKAYALSERRFYSDPKTWPENVPKWEQNTEKGEKFAVQTGHFKLIFNTVLGEQFYDLEQDPYELNNLAAQPNVKEKDDLMRILVSYFDIFKEYKKQKGRIVDRKTRKRLKSLGYIF